MPVKLIGASERASVRSFIQVLLSLFLKSSPPRSHGRVSASIVGTYHLLSDRVFGDLIYPGAMAATAVSASLTVPAAVVSKSAVPKSAFCGTSVSGLPVLSVRPRRTIKIEASGGKKINTKTPLGPSGGTKFRNGVDASGSKAKGKGVYQYAKKYGANVDGYSPIYVEEEWAKSGGTYAGGQAGLALWAVTFAGLLAAGAFLVYSTSALSS